MITEHHIRGYPSHLLADTFRFVTWGMGLTSVASGFVGDLAVRRFGSMAPFNVAIVVSGTCAQGSSRAPVPCVLARVVRSRA